MTKNKGMTISKIEQKEKDYYFITKTKNQITEHSSGFKKEDNEGKPRYDLIPLDVLKRLAELYERGAKKYGDNNWKNAKGNDLDKFKESAFRHFISWQENEQDEDHAIAAVWNIFAFEHLKEK